MTDNANDALREQEAEALVDAKDDISVWGQYASEYFQDKHDLDGNLVKVDRAIRNIDEALK